MSAPKFAKHLPAGKGLDAVFLKSIRAQTRLNIASAPSHRLVVEHWGSLEHADRVVLAEVVDNEDTLRYMADNTDNNIDVSLSLIKNRKMPVECTISLMAILPMHVIVPVLYKYKTAKELALICANNPLIFDKDKHRADNYVQYPGDLTEMRGTFYEKCGQGIGDLDNNELLVKLVETTPEEYRGNLLQGLLGSGCAYTGIKTRYICDIMLNDGENFYGPTLWGLCGKLVGGRGYADKCADLLAKIKSPDMRAEMFAEGVPLVHLLRGLDIAFKNSVLQNISQKQKSDTCRALNLQDTRASSQPALAANHHSLTHDQEAVNWLVANADSATVGATIWQSSSDHLIATVLRSNTDSHRWASKHIWKLNAVWPKIGVKHKKQIAETLTDLHSLAVGPVREWILEEGSDTLVWALTLKKTEIKKLTVRLEENKDVSIAWIVAMHAERPKERINAAIAGMRHDDWASRLPVWLASAGSGDIVKLWQGTCPELQNQVSGHLIASLRKNEDTLWVHSIIGEITTQWSKAPEQLQEAAAFWLHKELGENSETWDTVLSLYSEWHGTLENLCKVVKNI